MHHEADNHTAGIAKAPTGVPGVDEVTRGGLPRRRTTLVMGGPGCGKTIFALQTLVNAACQTGEPGIFVAFEENSRHIIENAGTFGWDLSALEREQLFFLDARMPAETVFSGTYDLAGLLASLTAKAAAMGATRVVFDSVDVLLTLLGDARAERCELYRIHDWLAESGLTGIITTRVGPDVDLGYSQHFGFLQFMADCVVLLDHQVVEQTSLRNFRVVKYRGSGFAENAFPMVITETGIEVASMGVTDEMLHYHVSTERIATGVERLDTMLGGGYLRGSGILITGAPGTAKTTLGGAFAQAACARGERALFITFDESADEVVRNLASVNIRLHPCREAGLLQIHAFRAEGRSAEEYLVLIRRLINAYRPSCLVVDPLSALIKAGGTFAGPAVAQRLIGMAKQQGITTLCTSLLDRNEPTSEGTPLQVSTIADTWIHLSYLVLAGERNRALTIVKSRGTRHSNQVRELILSDTGLTLTDVYTAGGAVLMGALRAEKETQESLAREREWLESERRQRELADASVQAQARIVELERERMRHAEEIDRLRREQALSEAEWAVRHAALRATRSADLSETSGDGEDPDE